MDLQFMRLYDLYSPLLTKTQREIATLYFACDLSLAEIAEEKGCSRQSVSDQIAKCRQKLQTAEEKLGFARKEAAIRAWAEGLPAVQRGELESILVREEKE